MTPTDLAADAPPPVHPLKRLLGDLGAALQFLGTGLRQIDKNASFFPSSRFLVDAMVAGVPLEHAHCVVEFGPGTGVITEAILKKLPQGAHLHAIELDGELLETTTRRVNDPRLRPIHGSAADAPALLRAAGCSHGTSAVISSLGLALMNDALRDAILTGAREVLAPEGIFMQYSYPHARMLTYQFGQGWSRFNGKSFMKEHFRDVQSQMVLRNAPPAQVYTCREPLRVAKRVASPDTRRARRRRSAAGRSR